MVALGLANHGRPAAIAAIGTAEVPFTHTASALCVNERVSRSLLPNLPAGTLARGPSTSTTLSAFGVLGF